MILVVSLACLLTMGCGTGDVTEGRTSSPPASSGTTSDPAPDACLGTAEADRSNMTGAPVWVRFCPGRPGRTTPAEVPSDALTTHLELLDGLVAIEQQVPGDGSCRRGWGRGFRVQIGYADGEVVQIDGRTDPGCAGSLAVGNARVAGPDGLGVYGLLMTAFGLQYADRFGAVESVTPLACPDDPRRPGAVDVDGASAGLDTGWHLGVREPMTMPLPAVRGIVCMWQFGDEDGDPDVRELTVGEAERVRIGLHAIQGGMVDCATTSRPTITAVVEDKTGTRRAVTVIESECSTVVRSNDGFGLGFAWLDR